VKILFIGDMHIKITQFELGKQFLSWVNDMVAKYKPDLVINLGDTFDSHAVIRAEIMSEYVNHVDACTQICPYVHVLGNHEMYKPKDATYHALQAMHGYHAYKIVDKPTDLSFICPGLFCVPYVPSLSDFPKDVGRICVAHQTFVGADYGYHRPDIGVDADTLSADIVISGHVHKRQSFGKVIYPGSPFANSANDIDQTKGVLILDTDTYKQQFIESPLPKYRGAQLTVNEIDNIDRIHAHLVATLTTNDNWILTFNGPRQEITAYLQSTRYTQLVHGKKVVPKIVASDKDKVKIEIKSNSILDIVSEYIDKVYSGECSKNDLKSAAFEVMK
jgi:DNA repair exonuclease SbcCD nuclease subunit